MKDSPRGAEQRADHARRKVANAAFAAAWTDLSLEDAIEALREEYARVQAQQSEQR